MNSFTDIHPSDTTSAKDIASEMKESTETFEELSKLSVVELKKRLKNSNKKTYGNKSTLVNRLLGLEDETQTTLKSQKRKAADNPKKDELKTDNEDYPVTNFEVDKDGETVKGIKYYLCHDFVLMLINQLLINTSL